MKTEKLLRTVVYSACLVASLGGLYLFIDYLSHQQRGAHHVYQEGFGGWSISKELFDYVRTIVPEGKTIVEMGSGWASGEFSRYYTVYSIEHDKMWLDRYNTHYIYAPLVDGWYDKNAIENRLPESYDLIIVDGPTHESGYTGFVKNLKLFNTNVPIIIDDVDRPEIHAMLMKLVDKLKRSFEVIDDSRGRRFAVIK